MADLTRERPSGASSSRPAPTGHGKSPGFLSALDTVWDAGTSGAGMVLRNIGRPGQAVMSGIGGFAEGIDKDGFDVGDFRHGASTARQGWNLKRHDNTMSVLKSFGAEDPFGSLGPLKGAAEFGANLGGAVVTDPLTWVTLGAEGLAVRLPLVGMEKSIVSTEALRGVKEASGLGALGRGIKNTGAGKAFADTFIPRARLGRTLGRDVADSVGNARAAFTGQVGAQVEDKVGRLVAASRNAGATREELEQIIGPALDIGGRVGQVPEYLKPVFHAADDLRRSVEAEEAAAGIIRGESRFAIEDYLPRVPTKQARKASEANDPAYLRTVHPRPSAAPAEQSTDGFRINLPDDPGIIRPPKIAEEGRAGFSRAVGPGGPRMGNLDDPHLRRRRVFEEDAAWKANDVGRKAGLGYDLFEPNPIIGLADRAATGAKAVGQKRYLDDLEQIRTEAGEQILSRVPDDFDAAAVPEGFKVVDAPRIGKYLVHDELVPEVERVLDVLIKNKGLDRFLRGWDRWQQLGKSYATVPLVSGFGFHSRNAQGNMFVNMLAGISPLDSAYRKAFSIQRAMSRGKKASGNIYEFLTDADRALVEEARHSGAIGSGIFDADFGESAVDQATKFRRLGRRAADWNPLDQSNMAIRSGRALGSGLEDHARLAHFLVKRREGLSVEKAAASVRKYLFDYADLTPVEREVFKRVVPFYTYSRKILPVILEGLVKKPQTFSRMQWARSSLASQSEAPEQFGDFLKGQGAVPLSKGWTNPLAKIPALGFQEDQQYAFAPDLPLLSASETLSPLYTIASNLPGLNRVLPSGGDAGNAFREMSGNVSFGPAGAFRSLVEAGLDRDSFLGRSLNGSETPPIYMRPFTDENGEMTRRSLHLLRSNIPLIGKVDPWVPSTDYRREAAPRGRLSALTGLRLFSTDERGPIRRGR